MINPAWADSYTITFGTGSGDGSSASTSTACSAVVSNGASYLSGNLVTATNVYYNGSGGLKLGKSSNGAGTIKMKLASAVTPTTIVVSAKRYNSSKAVTLKVNSGTGQSLSTSTNFEDYTYTIGSEISYIELNTSQYAWIKSITVNYTSASTVATPTITIPDGPFVSSKNVTITCATAGASISYSTDNGETWNAYSAPFSIDETTTVKAKATKADMTDSEVASATFTKETVLDGLAGLVAQTNTSDQSYYVNLTDAQVTYVNNKNGYMEDSSAGIYIYNITPTLNKVYNGIFQITYQLFNSMPELKGITAVEGEITDGSTKAPTEMTASALKDDFTANLGRKIQITNHTITTTTVLITGVNFYTTYYNPSFESGKTYTIIGYPYNNNGTYQYRVTAAFEKPDVPTFSPAEGEFAADFELTMSAADGTTIYYTTDGTIPTTSSTLYNPASKPTISAGADVTVKAIAVLAGMTSDVASATYTYSAISKPAFSPASGTALYYGETIAISSDVDGATIYYTTNGDAPTSSSSVYSTPIAITADVTIKAMAKKGGDESSVASASYTLKAPDAPNFNIAADAVAYGTELTISSATGTTIKYTTDGSDPSSSGTATAVDGNSKTIAITAAMTIKAIALDGGSNKSSETSATYTIQAPAAPTFDVAAGSIAVGTIVTITGTGTIRYTTNGVDPTSSTGEVYSAPVSIDTDCTLKAICVDGGGNVSSVTSAAYTVIVPIPGYNIDFEADLACYSDWTITNAGRESSDITAHGGTYYGTTGGKTSASFVTKSKVAKPETLTFYVSKTTGNTNASTWYVEVSSDGSSWTQVTTQDATSMSKGSWTKVQCDIKSYTDVYVRIRYSGSNAVRAIDDISLSEVMPVAAPAFSVASGIYTVVKSVEITCATEGATIYYTTNGDTPTSSSSVYSSALSIDTSCTLKAIAIKGEDQSNVSSATYVINLPTEYNLATEITSGKHYVIASGKADGTVQVMTDQNTTYRNKTNASVDTNVLTASGACEVIICGPDADNYYTIYDAAANGYLYASSSNSNDLKTQSTIDNNARWSISIDGTTGVASIVAHGSNSRNTLQYNSGSPRFTCYSSANQTDVYLFEKDGEATPTENIIVGSTGYTTYTTTNAVSLPVGTTAYIVTAIGANSVTLAEKASVPARTPVIIEASAGNYDLTSVVSPESVTGNLLQASDGTVNGDGSTIFALGVGKTGANEGKVGFYLVGSGVQVPAGKAYLVVGGGAKEFLTFDFDDEATSIEETLSDSTLKGENIYNLAGQRLNKMQKGINIVNGKKVLR